MKTVSKIVLILAVIIILFFSILAMFEPPLPRSGLVFEAHRESSPGGIWLGLYDDKRFEMGNSRGDANCEGYYTFKSDTLTLRADKGIINKKNLRKVSFLLQEDFLVETPKTSGISFLEVRVNHLKNKVN
ncbi:hypothetical protein GCM10028808_21970 [Spirosoma migulaei]